MTQQGAINETTTRQRGQECISGNTGQLYGHFVQRNDLRRKRSCLVRFVKKQKLLIMVSATQRNSWHSVAVHHVGW